MELLKLSSVSKKFGGLLAVDSIDFSVSSGEILGIIGPNGAGKSTLMGLISGSTALTSGAIFFNGSKINKKPVHKRARLGVSRVFQENVLFKGFTVKENIEAALSLSHKTKSKTIDTLSKEYLERYELTKYSKNKAEELSHGKQRLLSIAMAVSTDPHLLLLDEPFSGLTAHEIERVSQLVSELCNAKKIGCILIEHNLRAVMKLCHRIVVIHHGKKIADGLPSEIANDSEVIKAYLGSEWKSDS